MTIWLCKCTDGVCWVRMNTIWRFIKKWWWVWVIVLILVASFVRGSSTSANVTVSTAANETIERTVLASGVLDVDPANMVYAPLAGVVKTMHVKDGDTVAAGDPIFTYDATSIYAALTAARSQLATAQSVQKALTNTALTAAKRASLQASVDAAASAQQQAQSAYDASPTATTLAALDAAAAAYKQAVAAQESAITAQPNQADYDKAQAAVDAAQAAVWDAENASNKRTVTATVAGVIAFNPDQTGSKIVEGRATVTGQLVATIVAPTALRFKTTVDETDLAVMKSGQIVHVTLDAYPGETFSGVVHALPVLPEVSATGSNVYTVTIDLNEPRDTMRVGMQGQASVVVQTTKDVLAVPSVAVFTLGKQNEVVTVKNGVAHVQDVEIGVESTELVQILTGLTAGDTVVTSDNARDLTDGQQVTVQ